MLEILADSIYLPLIMVTVALVVERFLPWPEQYHPLTLFRLIAGNLARKVNPRAPRSNTQRRISGTLAIIVLLIPMLAIAAFSSFVAAYPWFFDLLMLIIALRFNTTFHHFHSVRNALKNEKKALAKHHLAHLVLRKTDKLSSMGIGKAAIEGLLLRFFYQQFAIVFWFFVGGGLAALSVRLLYELRLSWNRKLSHNKEFGAPIAFICQLIFLPPVALFSVFFSLGYGFIGTIRAISNKPTNLRQTDWLKLMMAGSLGFQLGGPAYYETSKVRSPKVGPTREIRFDDLQRASFAVTQTTFLSLAVAFLLVALYSRF